MALFHENQDTLIIWALFAGLKVPIIQRFHFIYPFCYASEEKGNLKRKLLAGYRKLALPFHSNQFHKLPSRCSCIYNSSPNQSMSTVMC